MAHITACAYLTASLCRRAPACIAWVSELLEELSCCSAGGRGVIEGLGSQLGLSQRQLEPSASTLYWYGNTSSSSLWYALSYIESRQTVKKGDRVWQVSLLLDHVDL